jgi:serine/threonine protein kinase
MKVNPLRRFFQNALDACLEQGLPALLSAAFPAAGFVVALAAALFKRYQDHHQLNQLRDDIHALVNANYQQVLQQVRELLDHKQQLRALPPDQRNRLELYLTYIPQAIQQSLRRPEDPSGRTLPPQLVLDSPHDLAPLLPPRPPLFRPNDPLPAKPGWILQQLLGVGGCGEVWLAVHPQFNTLQGAVKFCLGPTAPLLRHEAQLIDRIIKAGEHPHIVPIRDLHLEGDTPWLMYEYVPGGTLTEWIRQIAQLSLPERLQHIHSTLRHLSKAVAHVHALKPPVVHRDLKPSNILLDSRTGRLRITDFGIGLVAAAQANHLEQSGLTTRQERLWSCLRGAYTPLYSSPQQRRGEPPDPRDDIHALGVIAYQMLLGRLDVSPGINAERRLRQLGLDEGWIRLVLDCVSEEAADRPQDAGVLLQRLQQFTRSANTRPQVGMHNSGGRGGAPVAAQVDQSQAQQISRSSEHVAAHVAVQVGEPSTPSPTGSRRAKKLVWASALVVVLVVIGWSLDHAVDVARTPSLTLQGHTDWVLAVAWSPDGQRLATASGDSTARVWDATTGTCLRTLQGHTHRVIAVAWSPDGQRLATASWDNTARVWDATTGTCLRTLQGHTMGVNAVAWSPDGQRLATASSDNTARVWDATTGTCLRTLQGHTEAVGAVAWSPDGQRLATASCDKTARVWDISRLK